MAFCCCTGKNMTKGVADRVDPLEELRRHGLTRSPAPQLQHEETAVPVSINVYSLTPRNRRLRKIGFGIFHTGVVVYGIEWGYGEAVHNPNASGLFYVRPGEAEGSLYKHIRVGYTTKSPAQVDTILHRLENEWRSSEYHILHHNCNHFAQAFCDALSSRERLIIPSWCNRAARISDKVLPQKLATKVQRMLDGLPPTASVPSEQNNDHNKNNNAEWRQHVSGIPVSVVPKYWYLHPSVRQPPRYITKPTPTPLTVSELVHSTSTPLPTPLSAFEKESPAFAHQIRNNTINGNDESSNINYTNYNNHVLQSNGIGGSSMAAIQHLHELHVTESNVPAPGQSDSFIAPSSSNTNINTNGRIAPETVTFTSSSSASLAPVHHIPLPPPPPPPPSSHSRKIITPTERLSLIATEHNEERNILEKMSSANSPRRLPPISPLLSVNTRAKDEDNNEDTHSNDKHVDVNKMDVEEEMNDTQWELVAHNNDEDNKANQESEEEQDINEENNLYSSVSASSEINDNTSRNNRRSSSYREELVSSSANEELRHDEKKIRQTLHDENEIMTVEIDESVKSTSEKVIHNNNQMENEIDIDNKDDNDKQIGVKHTVIPVSSWLKQIHEQEEEEEEINSELLVEENEMQEEEEKEFYSLEEEELPEEEPQMSRLSHRSSVMTTGSQRVSPSRSPTRIAYTTTMRSFISHNNNIYNNSIDNSNRYNSYNNNKSTIANSAPPALSLEDDDVQKEKEGKVKMHEGRSDNNSMFDITQRELNAMFDGVSSNHEGKWHNEELELLSSLPPSSLSCRVREYALQQRRHVRAESKPEMTRYNTFMVEKEPISPTLSASLHKEQIQPPLETVKVIRDTHIDSDDDVANHDNIMSASQNSEKVCTAVSLLEHKQSNAIHHAEENESHTLPMKFAVSVLAKQNITSMHKNNQVNVHNSTEDEKEVFVKSDMRSSLHDSRTAYSKRPCYSQDDSLLNVNTLSSTTLLEPTLRRSLSEGNLLEKHTLTSTNKEEYELYQPISNNVLESENTEESEKENNIQVCKENESNTYNVNNNTSSSKSKTCNECSTTDTDHDDIDADDEITSEHVNKSAESQDGDLYCHSNLRDSNNSDNNNGRVKHYSWNLSDHDEIELYSPIEYNSTHENVKAKSQERPSSANKKNCRSYSYNYTKLNNKEPDHESSTNVMRREKTTLLISPEPDWEVHDMERERKAKKLD